LKDKLEAEVKNNRELIGKITRLNDVVKVHEDIQDESRLITEENQNGWKRIYRWAEKFNLFVNKLVEAVP
jgi:hypothetical protein